MGENNDLRQMISDTADQLTSELYTDDKVQQRVAAWQKSVKSPSTAEAYAYLMAETRDYSEELVYRVLTRLNEAGYLAEPKK